MTNEERAKYFLVDIFKNSRFKQAVEENKSLVIDCYQLAKNDDFFMLELRDVIANSGEEFDYEDPITNLLQGGVLNHANLGSVLKLKEFGSLKYSEENLKNLIDFLKHETDPKLHEFTRKVFEESKRFDHLLNFKSGEELELYEALYEENTKLLKNLERVEDEEDYKKVIKIIRWEENK